ncbi:MAG: hypothetical protein CBB68_10590 [Rhodospirillaceae bacterium TMED8]|nr:AMP-dependent synthetase [Magnetovibrio sp.]OUT49858.1 MAG: hypothetical protein CBB68_10590 [Rhodospirillaceae bacterium TMED8]
MNLARDLLKTAKRYPALPAVALGERTVETYASLAQRSAKLASGLTELGLRPGDRIAIFSKNHINYIETIYAIWWGGFAAVPINSKLHGVELNYILENSGAKVCFVSAEQYSVVRSHALSPLKNMIVFGSPEFNSLFQIPTIHLKETKTNDLAWLFYTSGTTGRPKGAMLTHGNMNAMSSAYLSYVDPTNPGDAILHAAPLSHGSGIYMIPHIRAGACNVITESDRFNPKEIFILADSWPGSSLFAAPTMVKRMTECSAAPPNAGFRTISFGGGPMYTKDARAALERFGPCLVQIYGQGESPMTISICARHIIADKHHPKWLQRLASVGTVNPAVQIVIANPKGKFLPAGRSGEILVRGPSVMKGYWNNPEASANTLKNGWLHTGDIGVLTDDGFLTLKDRAKDLIISGGSNIYPREVEEVLLEHPDILEVSIIGRPDPEWGEIIIAYIVGTATPVELDQLCIERIARFKRPKFYFYLKELPKNNYGKILKTVLRDLDLGNQI